LYPFVPSFENEFTGQITETLKFVGEELTGFITSVSQSVMKKGLNIKEPQQFISSNLKQDKFHI
jgi:formyltetrahydrofolate hydrolase